MMMYIPSFYDIDVDINIAGFSIVVVIKVGLTVVDDSDRTALFILFYFTIFDRSEVFKLSYDNIVYEVVLA